MLTQIFAQGSAIWTQRADLRQRFPSAAGLDYWIWLMSDGLREYPTLAALVPVPPIELIGNVISAAAGVEFFQESGLSEARQLFALLGQAGFEPGAGGALLDFGCGCARILRFMARFCDSLTLHGADPDTAAIDWCKRHLDYATFTLLPSRPPSPYAPGMFRAVYAYSVFTHLEEKLHRAWLEELHRITAPGAQLVLTTAGQRCVEELLGRRAGQFRIPNAAQLRAAKPRLASGEYVFFPYDFKVQSLPDDMAPEHGMTFLYPAYIRSRWADLFEIVATHEGPSGWQDYIVLRRR